MDMLDADRETHPKYTVFPLSSRYTSRPMTVELCLLAISSFRE